MGFDNSDIIAGMISRGIPEKGWELAISVVQTYNKTHDKKIKLILIGDGEYLRQLVSKTHDENIKLIQFEKNFQDYFSYYPLFDFFIFPTRFKGESFPNVILEAMSWGVPCISVQHAEIPSMIAAGTKEAAGICVEYLEDSDEQIQKLLLAVKELTENPNLLKTLSENSRRRSRMFSLENIADEYLEFFQAIKNKQ